MVRNWFDALRNTVNKRGVNLGNLEDIEELSPASHDQLLRHVTNLKNKTGQLFEILIRRARGDEDKITELVTFLDELLSESGNVNESFNSRSYDGNQTFADVMPMEGGIRTWVNTNAQTLYDAFLNDNPYGFTNAISYVKSALPSGSNAKSLKSFIDALEQKPEEFTKKVGEYSKSKDDEIINNNISILRTFMTSLPIDTDITGYELHNAERLTRDFSNRKRTEVIEVLKAGSHILKNDYLLSFLKTHTDYSSMYAVLSASDGNALFTVFGRMFQLKKTKGGLMGKKRGVGPEIEMGNKRDFAMNNLDLLPEDSVVRGDNEDDSELTTRKMDKLVSLINKKGSAQEKSYEDWRRSNLFSVSPERRHFRKNTEVMDEINKIDNLLTKTLVLYQIYEDDKSLNDIPDNFLPVEPNIEGAGNQIKNTIIMLRKLNLPEPAAQIVSLVTESDVELVGDSLAELASDLNKEKLDSIINKGNQIISLLNDVIPQVKLVVAKELNKAFSTLDPINLRTPGAMRLPKYKGKFIDEWLINNRWLMEEA
tara:strand:+ start:563 stop:2179 length:1617 start_codon:yes stop_codon:yes gene_type:complete